MLQRTALALALALDPAQMDNGEQDGQPYPIQPVSVHIT